MSIMPTTTSSFSVKRSSRPKKSPYSESSPVNVVSPRLWYSVSSFSQLGTFSMPVLFSGVSGKLVFGFSLSAGKLSVPAKSRSSNGVPAAVRYGSRSFET